MANAANSPDGLVSAGEQPAGLVEELGAGVGESHAVTIAEKQAQPERSLETSDGLRERGLAHERASSGAAEVKLLGDRNEVLKLTKLDRAVDQARLAIAPRHDPVGRFDFERMT